MRALDAKEQYRSILENAVFGIYRSTLDGQLQQVNPAFVHMLGYDSAEELLAVNIGDLYQRPHERDELIRRQPEDQDIDGVEVHWAKKDGEAITVRLNGRTVYSETDGIGFEVIAEEVTDRRSLEEQVRQAQKMEAVGRLAGAVAHDFNNILTVIVGQAQLLLEDDSGSAAAYAEEIMDSGQRAARLTRQLLAFSRQEDIKRFPVHLDSVIGGLESMLRRLLGEDVELVSELALDLKPTMGDPGQIEQVLMNLVVNAQSAMPTGGRVVIKAMNRALDESYLRSHMGVQAGEYLVVSVSDTGVGMSEAVQSKVFEPFFTTKPAGMGSGLGLSTVYGIVTQYGGHIELASELGVGTTFTLYLPVADASTVRDVAPVRKPLRSRGSGTVLVVEDEAAVRRVVCKSLERSGYQVLEAEGSREGLAIAKGYDGPIDLLLSDVAMPGLRGPELAEMIAAERPDMRVLFISGYAANPESIAEVLGSPASFLAKPFTPLDVIESVWSILHDRRQVS